MTEKSIPLASGQVATLGPAETIACAAVQSIIVGPSNLPEGARISSSGDQRTANNSTRQTYRVLSTAEKDLVDRVKTMGAQFIELLHEIGGTLPGTEQFASRNLSLANTHIEDAVMRAVRHINQ